jgi:hypothetical protein
MAAVAGNSISGLMGRMFSRRKLKTTSGAMFEVTYDSKEVLDVLKLTMELSTTIDQLCTMEHSYVDNDQKEEVIASALVLIDRISLLIEDTRWNMQLRSGTGDATSSKGILSEFYWDNFGMRHYRDTLAPILSNLDEMLHMASGDGPGANTGAGIIDTIPRRRRSTDTMSTMSIPPPPYGLVDWSETKRLQDLMG